MIEVKLPGWLQTQNQFEAFGWALVNRWTLGIRIDRTIYGTHIIFKNEEDAIVFKLRFGV